MINIVMLDIGRAPSGAVELQHNWNEMCGSIQGRKSHPGPLDPTGHLVLLIPVRLHQGNLEPGQRDGVDGMPFWLTWLQLSNGLWKNSFFVGKWASILSIRTCSAFQQPLATMCKREEVFELPLVSYNFRY